MKEYTKTICVQAVQWTGENLDEVQKHFPEHKLRVIPNDYLVVPFNTTVPLDFWLVKNIKTGQIWSESGSNLERDYKEVTQ